MAFALSLIIALGLLALIVALAWGCYGMERDARADRAFYAQLASRNARRTRGGAL